MNSSFTTAEYFRPAGLGNKLFPWARAKLLSRSHDISMLRQIWFSPRGAGFIRGGIDYSRVLGKLFLLNNFIDDENEMSIIKFKINYANHIKRISIHDLDAIQPYLNLDNILIEFKWNSSHNFKDLIQYREVIYDSLIKITKPDIKKIPHISEKFIGLNIRTGNDFISHNSLSQGYRKTSFKWFSDTLILIREKWGNLPIYVVSDGGYDQLKYFLQFDNLYLTSNKTAIEDLFFLSHADVLIGSGNSSFLAWASFLGNKPTYVAADTNFSSFCLPNSICL